MGQLVWPVSFQLSPPRSPAIPTLIFPANENDAWSVGMGGRGASLSEASQHDTDELT